MSCVSLVNMSTSESFGIVLLEAWLANKPVIANRNCAAFHDMAIHEKNALLVAESDLAEAIVRLLGDPELASSLGRNGREVALRFDWRKVSEEFLAVCSDLAKVAPVGG
jgi:glycosyltransferase involved in cell wall biosynthesis